MPSGFRSIETTVTNAKSIAPAEEREIMSSDLKLPPKSGFPEAVRKKPISENKLVSSQNSAGQTKEAQNESPLPKPFVARTVGVSENRLAAKVAVVPNAASIQALSAGTAKPDEVANALKTALVSSDLKVVQKAIRTLQIAEAYQRKAGIDARNFKNPSGNPFEGFVPVNFPKLSVKLTEPETKRLMSTLRSLSSLAGGTDKETGIALMSAKAGLLQTDPPNAIQQGIDTAAIPSPEKQNFQLPGSQGLETPRGGAVSFTEEFDNSIRPAMKNIELALELTAERNSKITKIKCPYAQGNHAKGVAFGDVKMKVEKNAPEWAKDLFGEQLSGGMLRVSGSQTDPLQPDSDPHLPGLRLALPMKSPDGSTQLIDLTAISGDTTHAQTADRHTEFTLDTSLPSDETGLKKTLTDNNGVRGLKHLIKGGNPLTSGKELVAALGDSLSAGKERFHEHEFFGRHAYFVGGRYVQIRFAVEGPKDFSDPNDSASPNARLDAVSQTVAKKGMKLAMYVTELPPGADPGLIEKEYGEKGAWKGLPEYKLATIDVPAQRQTADSKAAQWFAHVPHVAAGDDKVFKAEGLGRHRLAVYATSGLKRAPTPPDATKSDSLIDQWAAGYMSWLKDQNEKAQ